MDASPLMSEKKLKHSEKKEQKDREQKEVRDYMRGPKESCGTSLAALLQKSGF